MKLKKDDQIFYSLLLIAGSIGFAGLLLVNKYVQSTVVHYIEYCQQSLGAFLSSPTHIIGIFIASLLTFMVLVVVISTSLSLVKMISRIQSFQEAKSKSGYKRIANIVNKMEFEKINIRIISNNNPLALSLGFFKKTILLSEHLLKTINDQELEAVILHELAHIKQRHSLKLFFSQIIKDVFFFVPIVRELVSLYHTHIELQADKYVLQTQSTNRFLKSALAKIVSMPALPYTPSFQNQSLKLRILQLNEYGKRESFFTVPKTVSKSLLFLTLLFLALFLLPTESKAESQTVLENQTACEQQHSRKFFSEATSFSHFK